MTIFEVATPIINILGIAQVILGLLLWFGARQEFLGWRLIVSGLLMLIFVNIVAPFLLSFI
jgi:multisubunit Na+/H+ antiporter MnhG subunit